MRLFLYEDICGGGCANQDVAFSLKTEALAMLRAIFEDFSNLEIAPDGTRLEIVTHWDRRLGESPFQHFDNLKVVEIDSPSEAEYEYIATLRNSDAALVIAPESENRLHALCQSLELSGCKSFNTSPSAIQLCGDKLAFAKHLQQSQILTIPTCTTTEQLPDSEFLAVKPRFGAGSIGIDVIRSSQFELASVAENVIVQPLVRGEHCSVGCFYNSDTDDLNHLPIAKQQLSTDGHFRYQGGSIPVKQIDRQSVAEMVRRVVDSVEGLNGYFGIDFIVPENGQPILVEVNPRLTTSYVGYRAMTQTNLANLFFPEQHATKIDWENQVTFTPSGEIETRPLTEIEVECCWN